MENLTRKLQVFVEEEEIAQGCRIILSARQTPPAGSDLSSTNPAQPQLHQLEIYDLSDSSEAKISAASTIEVRSGSTILAAGDLVEACTRSASGRRITSIVFSPGYVLWQSSVSLSLAAGMKVSETIRAILNAAGASVRLASYLAPDPTFLRPQAFFGRTCDALSLLAETAGAQAFLTPAGLCVLSDSAQTRIISLSEEDLLSPPYVSGSRLLVQTRMRDWLPGTDVQLTWKKLTYRGRVFSSLIQADNVSGPWKSELELSLTN